MFLSFSALCWIACLSSSHAQIPTLLDSLQVGYRSLSKAQADSMGIKPGDFIMEEGAFQAARLAVALERSHAENLRGQLRDQRIKGMIFRSSLDSLQQVMQNIIIEKDAEISALNKRYDSLIRRQNQRIDTVSSRLEEQKKVGQQLYQESFELDMDALRAADELSQQINDSDQAVGEWLKKKRKSERNRDSGVLRELLYHPTTTPVGRVLVGSLVLSFTALTVVTIISLTQ